MSDHGWSYENNIESLGRKATKTRYSWFREEILCTQKEQAMRVSNQEADEIMARPTCTVDEFAKIIGCGRSQAYETVRTGKVRSIRIGNRYWVPTDAIRELLQGTNAA
jgi:excisionase family DNA binding protein